MEEFIYKYYLLPIWDRTGYNTINTITYAILAIIGIFLIYKWLRSKFTIDEKFIKNIMCFVLIGSGYRVVTDAIDNGVFNPITPVHQWILQNHMFDYGYLTVTPGIYIVTAALLIVSILILDKFKKMHQLGTVGLILAAPAYLLLIPFMTNWIFAIPILLLCAIPAGLAYAYFKKDRIMTAIVAGQALDGAATFFIIDIFSKISGKQYFEQHVFSAGIGQVFGTFFAFYLLKVVVGFGAAYLLKNEKMDEQDKNFIAIAIMIMGFAPGIRDILRMMIGA
ncbi:DUF63 family protein [Candidatus Micrarchaeota archaeon]|nr:DUF63 family protein [Candidatus Micrarchaeota archaeon]